MLPVIVDPRAYDKQDATEKSLLLVRHFLAENGFKEPKRFITEPDPHARPPGKNIWHDFGFYWQGTIFVNVKKSQVPVRTPGFAWSFTGSKSDRTAPGIVAHEHGHYIHHTIEEEGGREVRVDLLNALNKLQHDEAPVSGYEPNVYELWAEASRLFILNPKLLEEGRPKRYQTLVDFGLKPCHDTPWRDVLQFAHPRIISMLERWMTRAL